MLAQGEDESDAFGRDPSRNEREHLCGCLVEPLHVVHDAQDRARLGNLGEQVERRETDEEAIRTITSLFAECHGQREPLRIRKRRAPVE
ncbi:hypothetical protein GCM10025869_29840 [Homoserinibacter gongjuensis]|uniref:Uncharacterized protein n=1 Tax=Homoserinibacter gongjuensis TaxID=1162968 RepID=A0ABQ6K081_9MICO|nr:hypothetical protein GCM10025869_29840 [Homoserinibacter gongjuensis]